MTFYLLSLGCLKNSADSGSLFRGLTAKGLTPTGLQEADLLLINTCGFIDEAKRQSIEEILRLAGMKDGRKLLVFGCLAKRYKDELLREIPEIDAIYGVGEEEKIIKDIHLSPPLKGAKKVVAAGAPYPQWPAWSIPLKIAEGCNRRCSFCVIPSIRGPFRSRRPEEILAEAEGHIGAGAKELLLVAQDLTRYEYSGYGLPALLKDMASISGEFWIRPLYLHPAGITAPLLEVIAGEPKICKYIDMPVQHSQDRMLRLMGRGMSGSRGRHLALIKRIREMPDVALRTTLLVGHPGETEEDFKGLMKFVEAARFERLGVFKYSKEEGTRAASMKGHLPKKIKDRRYEMIMRLQNEISLDKNKALVGRRFRALIEEDGVGRIYSQAPEIDGVTFIEGAAPPGGFTDITVTGAYDYDLKGATGLPATGSHGLPLNPILKLNTR